MPFIRSVGLPKEGDADRGIGITDLDRVEKSAPH